MWGIPPTCHTLPMLCDLTIWVKHFKTALTNALFAAAVAVPAKAGLKRGSLLCCQQYARQSNALWLMASATRYIICHTYFVPHTGPPPPHAHPSVHPSTLSTCSPWPTCVIRHHQGLAHLVVPLFASSNPSIITMYIQHCHLILHACVHIVSPFPLPPFPLPPFPLHPAYSPPFPPRHPSGVCANGWGPHLLCPLSQAGLW